MKENFIAGASASFLSKLFLQPFDTTKTILQSSANIETGYKNLIDCAVGVVNTQGVTGLYRGFGASIGTSAPSSAIFFATYEAVKKWTEVKFPHSLGKVGPIVAAAVGNVVASVVRVPPEVVKQRVQARVYPNMITAITEMSRTEGIGGFYTGYGIQLARDIPYAAIQFMTFETLKKAYGVNRPLAAGETKRPAVSEAKKVLTNLWMGAVAGLVASVVTTPMDVVKTRVMTQDLTQGAVKIGVRQTVRSILKHEGPLAFTYGMLPRVMLKVPASALFLVAYEGMKRLLIALEVTQQAANLVKERAAREARELARKAKAAKLKQRQEERERKSTVEPEVFLHERDFDEILSPRGINGISEAMLASMVLTGPSSRRERSSLRKVAGRKGGKT
jgi:solute carrier family 25 S-adenosylmethionine transporter 26